MINQWSKNKRYKRKMEEMRLKEIRKNERKSHIEIYSNAELYKEGSWLIRPIKTVVDLIPLFDKYEEINVLDLGCGVGRNCICIARHYYDRLCKIDCVNILDLAIEKLYANADEYGVTSNICGIVKSIDDYQIKERNYDLVMAVSSLEHVDSKETFVNKLREIEHGIRKNGIVCLVVNSNIKEFDKKTGNEILPQFEVCLPTEEMQRIFEKAFSEWTVLKSTVVDQQYDIPRDSGICELKTSVVTFVAKKG